MAVSGPLTLLASPTAGEGPSLVVPCFVEGQHGAEVTAQHRTTPGPGAAVTDNEHEGAVTDSAHSMLDDMRASLAEC